MLTPKTILAIDPGSRKCGLALIQRDEDARTRLLWRAIRPPEDLSAAIDEARGIAEFEVIVIGSGTGSRPIIEMIRESQPGTSVMTADEKNTTQQARERYWQVNGRKWYQRLLPATMFIPKEPIDDFAALILGERVLSDGA
ncbi:MAG: hypothetical protein KF812_12650 [Fimbriimonadaceae bacterium]|nr:hypothetical protein [Fimbriimonadaceae bacterium]